jgi:hypothetical protein
MSHCWPFYLINLRYLKFIRNLTSERQLLDSAMAITAMGLGLAGTMVPLSHTGHAGCYGGPSQCALFS